MTAWEKLMARLGMAVGTYDSKRDAALLDDLLNEHAHQLAEQVRELSRQGYSAQECANKIDPKKRRDNG